MYGWMDGWMDGWVGGWMNVCMYIVGACPFLTEERSLAPIAAVPTCPK